MRLTVLFATGACNALIMTGAFAQTSNDNSAQIAKRYLPEDSKSGELILPKNINEWV